MGNGDRKWEREKSSFRFPFILTLISFCFFSLFFCSLFFLGSRKWEWRAEEFFLFFFSFYFLFLGKQRGINWKKSKEILPLFLLNFLYFFFLKTLLFFSFSFFLGRGKRIEEIAFWRIIYFYKNIVVFEIAFLGKKIRQKFIFYTQNTLKNAKNQKIFAKNIFGEIHMKFLAEFLVTFSRSSNARYTIYDIYLVNEKGELIG